MTDRTCPNCGTDVPSGAAFCPNCGTSVAAPPASGGDPTTAGPAMPPPPTGDRGPGGPPPAPPGPAADDPTRTVVVGGPGEPTGVMPPAGGPMGPPPGQPPGPMGPPPGQPPGPPPAWGPPGGGGQTTWGPPPGPPTAPPPPGPQWGPPGAPGAPPGAYAAAGHDASARRGRNVPAAVLAIVGGALAIAGSLLAWLSTDFGDVSGFDASNDAYTVLAVGVLGVALGVLWLLATLDPLERIGGFVALALGLVLTGVAIYDIIDVGDHDADVGIGLWLALAGGILLIVSGALGLLRRTRR